MENNATAAQKRAQLFSSRWATFKTSCAVQEQDGKFVQRLVSNEEYPKKPLSELKKQLEYITMKHFDYHDLFDTVFLYDIY